MQTVPYNRERAVAYADAWAFRRNPRYSDFSDLGGNCTNFISQCVYAGSGIMNFRSVFGWYYHSMNDRSLSWTGVEFFKNFLQRKEENIGPFSVHLRKKLTLKMPNMVMLFNCGFMEKRLFPIACWSWKIDRGEVF
jgi:hypothetical protein